MINFYLGGVVMMKDSASVVVLSFGHSNFLMPTVLVILKEFTLGNISCY